MTISGQDGKADPINKVYIVVVTVLTFVLPVICFVSDHLINGTALSLELFGKWFIFSAVGLRLFLAGIRQTTKPAFTAREIFHIDSPEVFPIVRELGFANLCFGIVGIVSLFKPEWRVVSACGSGLYYGFAGMMHVIRKPVGTNEKVALWTDLIIFTVLVIYFIKTV
ncbi:MAG TPA: DUF6790 family protein [Chitinophagaceae bacterium]|jgi:hypothetical protein|nr:DUF6790 family protein [Chitinophagaceae bacterium]